VTFDEYENGGRALYDEFATAVSRILRAAIAERKDLRLQNVQRRAKDAASLKVKLDRASAAPDAVIADIAKDIAGCRLIFYTNGDVHRFNQSRILNDNFVIDFDRSKIHYPSNSEEGAEFFISENWVVQLNEARSAMPEYRRFAGLRCEVQVQTILDHAWAEMAHDTIYKPMTDSGFGNDAVDAMRKRLRKVMREFLQPAGYAFEKIASDYSRLREGKAMFDGDALAAIRTCADRNCLHETIERFASYVLPHYDDYLAAAPEVIDALADAAVRAIAMPDVPHTTYFGEYPGTKVEAVLVEICRLLQSSYLLYADPERMFDSIRAMRAAASTDNECKPIDELTRRFAQHDRRAWQRVGPGLQRLLIDRMVALDDTAIIVAAPTMTIVLREALSSSVTGSVWQSPDTLALTTASVGVGDELKDMRREAIAQLKRLHHLLGDEELRANVRHAMTAAGNTPNNAGYSDALGEVIMDDLAQVVDFFTETAPVLALEPKRRLEVELFRLFYSYHVLPLAMQANTALVAAQGRLLEAMIRCRAAIDSDDDLARYKLLVGFDNITRFMWENAQYSIEESAAENTAAIATLVASVTPETESAWLERLERYVLTESSDMAMFMGLEEFIKVLAREAPDILLGWLPQLSERLSNWLPGMLHGLFESGHGDAVDTVITRWVADGRHLSSIAWYLQFAEKFRLDLLIQITDRALADRDDHVLANVSIAAARQSTKHADGLVDKIFLPAAEALTSRAHFGWTGRLFNWNDTGLLKGLSPDQADRLLALLEEVPQLGHNGEVMLAEIAKEHVGPVLDTIGKRFARENKYGDIRYEDLPHGLHYLKPPLAASALEVVAAARQWFDVDPQFSEFRGGRLIAELFPNLEHPLYPLLCDQIDQGREGIRFTLSVLRAYEGQAFLHPLLQQIVAALPEDDELRSIVHIVIESSGVLVGEYGGVEAQEQRKGLVANWAADERKAVRDFAASFIRSAENQLAFERRRADQSVAMRNIDWED
jgi:ppGpp synthetase/RelA/SpoT-type nucleotidyltranferase